MALFVLVNIRRFGFYQNNYIKRGQPLRSLSISHPRKVKNKTVFFICYYCRCRFLFLPFSVLLLVDLLGHKYILKSHLIVFECKQGSEFIHTYDH